MTHDGVSMPYDDPDPTDPQMLVGVLLASGAESVREMAYAFAEEFARMGCDRTRILRMFGSPFYAGAHGAFQALGAAAIERIVDECVSVYGRVQIVDVDQPEQRAALRTPHAERSK